jgi:hypothetical protein
MEKRKSNFRYWQVLVYLGLTILYACVQKEHFEVLNAKVPDKIPVVSDIAVVVFQHCDYRGYSLALSEGEYNLSDLMSHGVKNNDLSSLKVVDGYNVTFYDQVNFGGVSIIEDQDASCFAEGWNDRVSSLKITKIETLY